MAKEPEYILELRHRIFELKEYMKPVCIDISTLMRLARELDDCNMLINEFLKGLNNG